MAQHRLLEVCNTFTAGQDASFTMTIPELGFTHDYIRVVQVSYFAGETKQNPYTLQCDFLGGPICSFGPQFIANADGTNTYVGSFLSVTPRTLITNISRQKFIGRHRFYVTTCGVNGITPTTLPNGTLSVLLEFVKRAPKAGKQVL